MFYFNNQKSNCDLGKTVVETKYDTVCADLLSHNVTNMVFPKQLKTLDTTIFSEDDKLETVSFEEGSKTKSIGHVVFNNCINLKSVSLPPSLKSIGEACFGGCASLTEINIPNSVQRLPESCFYGCTSLTEIHIPDSVTSIGYQCFGGCNNLQTIYINKPMNSIAGAPWGIKTISVQWSDGVTPGVTFVTESLPLAIGMTPIHPQNTYMLGTVYLNENELPCSYNHLTLQSWEEYPFYQGTMEFFVNNNFELIDEFQLKFHLSDRTVEDFQYLKVLGDEELYYQGYDTYGQFMFNIGYNGNKLCEMFSGISPENGGGATVPAAFEQDRINFGWNTLSMKFDSEQNLWALYLNDAEYTNPLYIHNFPQQCSFLSPFIPVTTFGNGENVIDIMETGFKKDGNWVIRMHEPSNQ